MDEFINYKMHTYDTALSGIREWSKDVVRFSKEQRAFDKSVVRFKRRAKLFALVTIFYLARHEREIFSLKTRLSELKIEVNELTNDIGE